MKKIIYGIMILGFTIATAEAKIDILREGEYSCQEINTLNFCTEASGRALTGKLERRDTKGNLASIENYKNGWQSGLTTTYDEDGNRTSKIYYKEGIKNGIERLYYSNRTIKQYAEYKNGILHGKVEQYTPTGDLLGRMTYKNGYLQQGYCTGGKHSKKESFSVEDVRNTSYNQIKSCGVDE